jgi:DNA-directed RNA polymerase specialized sigma24 family protein
MLFVDGLSQGEAAVELGLSRVTINKRAQALRTQLRLDQTPSSTNTPTAKEARP